MLVIIMKMYWIMNILVHTLLFWLWNNLIRIYPKNQGMNKYDIGYDWNKWLKHI